MGTDSRADDRIDLPPDFADHLAAVSNLETPPETLAEYWSRFAEQLAASDQTIEPADLYTEEPTRHEVRVNGHIRYSPCVLDALGAAVMEPQDPVTVRSVDPVTKTPVTFTVDNGTVDVTPEDAVIIFGIASVIPELEASDECRSPARHHFRKIAGMSQSFELKDEHSNRVQHSSGILNVLCQLIKERSRICPI